MDDRHDERLAASAPRVTRGTGALDGALEGSRAIAGRRRTRRGLRIPVGTARSRYARARGLLAESLREAASLAAQAVGR